LGPTTTWPARLSSSPLVEAAGRTGARRPHFKRGRHTLAAIEHVALRVSGDDPNSRAHVHTDRTQLGCGRGGNGLWECVQNARPAFQQRQAQAQADVRLTITCREVDHAAQLGG
jgi:hypothetical protein